MNTSSAEKLFTISKEEAEKANELLLNKNTYFKVNHILVRVFESLHIAVFLSDLLYKQKFYEEKGMLDNEGYFFNLMKSWEDTIGLTPHELNNCIQVLKDYGILFTKRKGVPPKQYYRINQIALYRIIASKIKILMFKDEKINLYLIDINKYLYYSNKVNTFSEEKGESPSEESSMKTKILQMSKSKTTSPKEYPTNDLITYWNSLSQVPQHRNNTTKIYQEINSIIWKIKRGTFFSPEHTPITNEFLNRHDIDFKKIGKLNCDQIKKAFLHISLMYGSPAYEPKDKKYIHKLQSLKTLIYNPTSQNSWFLALLNNPPKKVKTQKASIMDKYPVEFEKYAEFCNATTEASKNSLRSELDKIVMFYRALPEVVHKKGGDFASFCSTEVKFLRHYLDDYLKNQDWLKDVNVSTIAVSGRVFPRYLKHHWDERSNYSGNCLTQYL